MLVDVVELRNRGVKRPRAQVLAEKPVRAELSLQAGRPGWHADQRNAPLLAGLLVPGETNWAKEPLDPARPGTRNRHQRHQPPDRWDAGSAHLWRQASRGPSPSLVVSDCAGVSQSAHYADGGVADG